MINKKIRLFLFHLLFFFDNPNYIYCEQNEHNNEHNNNKKTINYMRNMLSINYIIIIILIIIELTFSRGSID